MFLIYNCHNIIDLIPFERPLFLPTAMTNEIAEVHSYLFLELRQSRTK